MIRELNIRRAGARCLLGVLLMLPAGLPAQAADTLLLPPDLAIAIDQAVAQGRARMASDDALYAGLGNPSVAATRHAQNDRQFATDLASASVGLAGRYPQLAQPILQRFQQDAPEHAATVGNALGAMFPAMRGQTASGTAIQPVSWYGAPAASGPAPASVTAAPYGGGAANPVLVAGGGAINWYDQPALRGYGSGFPRPQQIPSSSSLATGLPATATAGSRAGNDTGGISDPLEPMNRSFHAFNMVTDMFIMRPIAKVYSDAPDVVKLTVGNALGNLGEPVVFANKVLQLSFADAGVTLARFGINSTLGLLGMFDVAETWFNMPGYDADFGQTLNHYGIGSGPYIELPLLGPSNVRDGVGTVADTFFDPLTYLVNQNWQYARDGVQGIAKREQLLQPLDDLRRNSLDYYVALRSASYQNRQAFLKTGVMPGPGTPPAAANKEVDDLFNEAK